MPIASVTQLKLAGKHVLLRCDFNVPLADRTISDPWGFVPDPVGEKKREKEKSEIDR